MPLAVAAAAVLVAAAAAVVVTLLLTRDRAPGSRSSSEPAASNAPTDSGAEAGPTPWSDWGNATYALSCDGVVPEGIAVTLEHGTSRQYDAGGYDEVIVAWEASATGDLTGDGVPDTAVLLACFPQPANFFGQEVQVFSSDGRVFSVLPVPSSLDATGNLPPEYLPAEFAIRQGQLTTGMRFYGPDDSHADGPSVYRTLVWEWTGSGFTQV
jgi:hypothetical protein